MPKKPKIDAYAQKDLGDHLAAVDQALSKLQFRLMHYFAQREKIRGRFDGLSTSFDAYKIELKAELDRRTKTKIS